MPGKELPMRVYGKVVRSWTNVNERGHDILVAKEVAYTDYDADWNVVGTGTEDFSPARWKSDVIEKWVWAWDGSRRNAGGHRWFDCHGLWKVRKSDRKEFVAAVAKRFYAADVSLR